MKKVKIVLSLLIVGFVALIVYQNQGIFLTPGFIALDLKFTKVQTPELLPIYIYGGCLAIGFLLAFFPGLVFKFKIKKEIKELNSVIDEKNTQIDELRNSISGLDAKETQPVSDSADTDEATSDSEEQTKENTEPASS